MAGPSSWVASGVGGCCTVRVFPFAAIFVFLLVSSLVFKSISFRSFYWGPLPGVDSGCLCTTRA